MTHVLIVEDDKHLRQFLRKALREEGVTVEEAASGAAALEAAASKSYDCIVLDVMLPERDGFDVLTTLRAAGVLTPILMLTARAELAHRVRGLESGADDYLAKPFDLAELLARIQALVRRARLGGAEPVLRVGPLTLHQLARRVSLASQAIDLSPREFALLEFLMLNAGRTLSRSRIAEAVWNYQFDPQTNVVDQYITYLRRKLAGDGDAPEIVTVRGVGYRLEVP
ncbi:MAG: response regulator transcription factor [Gemmatimonadetes bacterium]|nr:response regulator transcription factor [Gemmatimonadota bacterium]